MPSCLRRGLLGCCVLLAGAGVARAAFVNFESGHVRPLALAPGGPYLFAVNTPDNRLAVYSVTAGAPGLTLVAEVPVGLEPVAVAARTNLAGRVEAWVVNHLSDSVSIVEIDPVDVTRSHVTRTLHVGDEPRDIVFAGAGFTRAFITCAHRGQNRSGDPQLTTAGIGRADLWAFDANNPGAALGGTPLQSPPLALFCDTPRALAVSPDGSTVYAAAFKSGNRTTTISEIAVDNNTVGLVRPLFPPGSTANPPNTGLLVKFNPATNRWEDGSTVQDWSPLVPFSLPDRDVFLVDATATPPALVTANAATNSVAGVGTVLFNMAVRPTNGKLYVGNLEAQNQIRFEPTIHGHIAESRITVVTGTTAVARHLNPHINYGVTPGPQAEKDQSLAFPQAMVFSADGNTVFVPGFGSAKVGAYDANQLEAGTISKQLIAVGQGPSGVVLDPTNDRLYVMNRIDHTISVVSNASVSGPSRAQTAVVALRYDPSPAAARVGRRFLYDANISGHGDAACASCHIFGDMDDLAWDLGDPFGAVVSNPNPFRLGGSGAVFHPLKGPMTTQTLRGMAAAGPMHWRGDRTGGTTGGDPLDEDAAFKAFNPAFVGLLGNATQLSTTDMQAYTDFILTVQLPPNPIRALNNTLTSAQNSGNTIFHNNNTDGGNDCENCHRDPLGTDGFSSFEGEPQEFKIAHQRNLYQKIGMFGFPSNVNGFPGTGFQGDQVRGFGFLHDGSIATVFLFLSAPVFNLTDTQQTQVEQFVLSFDSGLRPMVGQQVSATPTTFTDANVTGRISTMVTRCSQATPDCDLVVKGNVSGQARGWVYVPASSAFRSDRASEGLISEASLRAQAGTVGQELTYTAVPPGNGTRIGIDRDEDGFFDRTELDAGSDPADPASTPGSPTTTTTTVTTSTTTTTVAPTTTTTTVAPTTTTVTTTSTTTTTVTTTTTTPPAPTTTSTTTTTATTTTTTAAPTTTTTASTTTTTSLAPTTTTTTTGTPTTSTTSTTVTTTSSTTTTTVAPFVLIPTRSLSLRDDNVTPIEPTRRRVRFRSVTTLEPFAHRIVPPIPGGPNDPRTAGATLVVYNSNGPGAPHDAVSVALASAQWVAIGTSSIAGYKYVGPDPNGPIAKVIIKNDTIQVSGGKANWPYTLDETAQERVAVRLVLADGTGWCADAPAKVSGTPPSTTSNDHVDKFVGQPKAPAPVACPALP